MAIRFDNILTSMQTNVLDDKWAIHSPFSWHASLSSMKSCLARPPEALNHRVLIFACRSTPVNRATRSKKQFILSADNMTLLS
jgi:hypothetical protein